MPNCAFFFIIINLKNDTKMIELLDGTKNLIINQKNGLFSDASYFIHLNVCKNPRCNCGGVNVIISTEVELSDNKADCVIPVNVHEKKIKPTSNDDFLSVEKNKDAVREFFMENLSVNDWFFLKEIYFKKKFDIIEHVNCDDIEFEFSRIDFEDESLMLPYIDIFAASFFEIQIKNSTYVISDSYCKNPQCNCKDLNIQIEKIIPNKNGNNTSETIGNFEFNYITSKSTIEGPHKKEMESVFQKMNVEYKNLQNIFERRHKIVKELYAKARLNFYKGYKESVKHKSIGRNDPCFCGSGKKFKNCCLKNETVKS